DGGLEGRARGGFGPIGEIGGRVSHAEVLHGAGVLGRVVKALAGGTGIFGVLAGDCLEDDAAIFGRVREGAEFIQGPGERHGAVAAHQPIGGAQGGDAAEGGRGDDGTGGFRADGGGEGGGRRRRGRGGRGTGRFPSRWRRAPGRRRRRQPIRWRNHPTSAC